MRAKWIWRIIGIVGFGLFLSACHQNGTVFAVDTTDDTVDVTPGDGICADANGDCSLRAAVMEANDLPGVEEIRVDVAAVLDGAVEVTSSVVFTGDGSIRGARWFWAFELSQAGLVEFDGIDFDYVEKGIYVSSGSFLSLSGVDMLDVVQTAIEVDGGGAFIESSSIQSGTRAIGVNALAGVVRVENLTTSLESPVGSVGFPGIAIRVEAGDVQVEASSLIGSWLATVPEAAGQLRVRSSIIEKGCMGTVASLGHNLVYGDGCGFAEVGDQLLTGRAANEQPADHGGDALTFRLPSGHPAVDSGPADGCTQTGRDGRGAPRPDGSACDVGAYELQQGDCDAIGPGADLRNCDLSGHDLRGVVLDGADLTGSFLDGADLSTGSLVGADLTGASVDYTDFSWADLSDALLADTRGGFIADDALLVGATLDGTGARSVDRADFTDANAPGFSTWYGTGSMVGAHIGGADFTGSLFWGVTSGGVTGNATGIRVINGYIIDRFVQLDGVDFSNHPGDVVFGNMGVRNSDLSNLRITASWAVHYDGSTLDGSDFSGTYTDNSSFRDASLVDVDMTGAQIESTVWYDAVVVGVDFTDASLRDSSFRDAIMLLNTFDNTTCPSGVNSDDNGGNCDGQFRGNDPLPLGGAAPASLEDAVAAAGLVAGGE